MKFICSLLILVLLLLSCNSRHENLVLKIEKISGLPSGSAVTLNKQKIGRVEIVMNQPYDEIIIQSDNRKPSKIPIDSKLQISDNFKFKKFELTIITGKSIQYFKSGDTLNRFKSNTEKELEKSILVGDYIFVTNKKNSLKKSK